ncbi:mitogen-activated protein kinase [Meyerozyma guilliermondii]
MSYVHEEAIYRGPHSDILRARDSNGKAVALKIVDIDLCFKPHDIEHEIALVKKLSHPNVLLYLDSYRSGEDRVLVTPLYQFDLNQLISHYARKQTKFDLNTGPSTVHKNELPLNLAKSIILGITKALEYVHANKIIHRDVKPANIYFSSPESEPILGDFGISYETGYSDEPEHEKYLDICSGSYKPPEVCFGVSNYSYEVDMWSLGILFTALYSADGSPPIKSGDSDIVLINSMFKALGTPSLDPKHSRYWPVMNNDRYHFKSFRFESYDSLPIEKLLPRCNDPIIKTAFQSVAVYEPTKRLSAAKLLAWLNRN